jgi:long-chain acyl-CoA synthetase
MWVRGANLFSGYWPDGADGPDAEGWLATGDLAYRDADGDLHLVDRRSDLVLVSGFNVYPAEVERVLEAHPAVAESAVIGVPDPRTGAAVRAVVVLRPGERVTAEQLREHAAASLARYKVPTSVWFLPALPHSLTGKVSRARLRELGLTRAEVDAGG